jgi:hypothetical protein
MFEFEFTLEFWLVVCERSNADRLPRLVAHVRLGAIHVILRVIHRHLARTRVLRLGLREPPLELFARRECTGAGERLRLAEQRFGVGDERLQLRQESLAFARRPGKEAARIAAAHRVGRRLRSVGPLHVSASSKGS